MAKQFIALALASLLALVARAQDNTSPQAKAVLGAEQQRVNALLKKDFKTLENLLSDDLIYIHSSGQVDTKAHFLKTVESGELVYTDLQHKENKVRLFGDTAIITTTTIMAVRWSGSPFNTTCRVTIVYMKQNGNWRMVSWHSTRIPNSYMPRRRRRKELSSK